jgi:hypothetical protein
MCFAVDGMSKSMGAPRHSFITLFPCGHKVNQDVVIRLFGTMNLGYHAKAVSCPLCEGRIRAYAPNHS